MTESPGWRSGRKAGRGTESISIWIRRNGFENRYDDIPSFMKSHEPGEFEAMLEKAREAAHSVGMPFAGVYDPDEDFDPYVYDGRMSLEDVELMHRLMEEGG